MTIIITFLLSLFFCGNAMAQKDNVFPNTMRITIDNKTLDIPLMINEKNNKTYYTNENFIVHDTTFIYNEYQYWREDSTENYTTSITSHFIVPHNHPNFIENINYISPMSSKDALNDILAELKEKMPVLSKQNLGDIPRMWYLLMKYKGAYYFSEDEPITWELTDSLLFKYDQELNLRPINNFKKTREGSWAFTTLNNNYDKEMQVSIIPCKKLKGAYIITTNIMGEAPTHILCTTDRDISNFDLIKFYSDHLPIGLDYENIDYETLMK
jgi:hypothetical protein